MKYAQTMMVSICALITGYAFPSRSLAADELDITTCISGSGTVFHDSKDALHALSWSQNGIITSHSPSKLLSNAVVHCDGVEHSFGADRVGHGLCKIMDDDGDVIIAEFPYVGFIYDLKFLGGTGKWKGVKGSLHSERLVRSKPGKCAMPGTYQGCRREQGTFELPK